MLAKHITCQENLPSWLSYIVQKHSLKFCKACNKNEFLNLFVLANQIQFGHLTSPPILTVHVIKLITSCTPGQKVVVQSHDEGKNTLEDG